MTTGMDETERCEMKRADLCHAIENHSSKEQICRYYQRDFIPSHVYRLGLNLFKKREKLCRRRLISATRVLHANGDLARKVTKAKLAPESGYREAELTTLHTELPSDHSQDLSGYDQQTAANWLQYDAFLAQRAAMRKQLEVVGITKNWLLSKQRTPLEDQQYQFIVGKRKSSATLMQKDSTQTTDFDVRDSKLKKTTDFSAERDGEYLSMKDRIRHFKNVTNLEELDHLKEYCEEKGVDKILAKRVITEQTVGQTGYDQQTAANRLKYKAFLAQRAAMRKELEVVGITKNELLSKQRTPLEEQQYQFIVGKMKSSATLMQKDSTQTTDFDVRNSKLEKTTDPSAERDSEYLIMKDRIRQYKNATNLEELDHLKEYCEQNGVRIDKILAKRGYDQQTAANWLQYDAFLAQRAAMRKQLEVVGITKNWLRSKQRTPLEERQYQIIVGKRKSSATLMQEKTTDLSAERDGECLSMKDRIRHYKNTTNLEELEHLKEYCEQKGEHIDITLAKRALLLPSDRQDSQIVLRQPSTSLPLYFDLATKEMTTLSSTQNAKGNGHVRQIQRRPGRKETEIFNLSTGICNVRANVDCWLSLKKYQEISRAIRRRKGESKTNRFWPGIALDVLRLPEMNGKACSLEAIFFPVIKSNSNTKVHAVSWPENASGYVQSGSSRTKRYHI